MFQSKGLQLISLSLLLVTFVRGQTVNSCWDPSTGAQVTCTSPTNAYCSTDFVSGIGKCSVDNSNSSLSYCNSNDLCNKFVTQCFNPANSTKWSPSFVSCDSAGLNQYCQVNFTRKIYF